ncbi:MAG: glutamyl-tRNA amidotransferase [Rhodospirillaceae bacterium]|nr:glutamyl-tRNA amidotransferase [Alphaproteobacteria bacterium]MBR71531.1 glutamyl-tRNA amidotransferase [Rhodospirillaceae bacterium]|tara:strand:- start:2297 stop:2764 length:468 start_codon:yes stop_codon:yes gene_type:complete
MSNLRQQLNDSLKTALKAREELAVSTIRLILAALKDRDIAARSKGKDDGILDSDIYQLLNTMIRQRRDSIKLYETGGRQDLADREKKEITVIERFLPPQIEGDDMVQAVKSVIIEIDAKSIKDMGRTMNALKEQYVGQMDFSKASGVVRDSLKTE